MPSNNFKIFNENNLNLESDAQYLTDSQRLNGVIPGIAKTQLHNKLFRQVSIMAAAIGEAIKNCGYDASDSDFTTLVNAITNSFATQNSVVNTPTIGFGMNSLIKSTTQEPVYPALAVAGFSYVNLLGKDGNCEDITKFNSTVGTPTASLDSTNKYFGSNGLKLVKSSGGEEGKGISGYNQIQAGHYYLVSVWCKNGNATDCRIGLNYDGNFTIKEGINSTSSPNTTTNWVRSTYAILVNTVGTYLGVMATIHGAVGTYAYFDGLSLVEISANDYNNLTAQQLSNKYPYADSYVCLQNPYFENRRDNLVINGNGELGVGYYGFAGSVQFSENPSGGFNIITTNYGTDFAYQDIKVRPNTNYYINGTTGGNGVIKVYSSDGTYTGLKTGIGTFNSGAYNIVRLVLGTGSNGSGTVSQVMLTEGTTAPSSYLPCVLQRFVAECILTSDDTLTIQGDKISGQKWSKHPVLLGKDYPWQYYNDFAGFKEIRLASWINGHDSSNEASQVLIKHDGKVIPYASSMTTPASADLFKQYPNGDFYVSIADSDSGWAESINPNNTEVAAFMNGWKAICQYNNRYVAWVSVVDASVPAGTFSTTVSNVVSTTQADLFSVTGFSINDYIVVQDVTGVYWYAQVMAISGNRVTFGTAITPGIKPSGNVIKCDQGGVTTNLVTWCANNVAPGYQGYQLHYKLQNPEPITDANCHIHGNVWAIEPGDNYVYLDSGIVLGESNLDIYNSGATYYINTINHQLRNKSEKISNVYKNGFADASWSVAAQTAYINQCGNDFASTTVYDPNATYTVDYKILATIAPQIATSIAISYAQSIANAVTALSESVEQCQKKDSTLDTLVDLSMYEEGATRNFQWMQSTSGFVIDVYIQPLVLKKVIPSVTILNVDFSTGNGSGTGIQAANKFSLLGAYPDKGRILLRYITSDAPTISNIKSYGMYGSVQYRLDCRGRV